MDDKDHIELTVLKAGEITKNDRIYPPKVVSKSIQEILYSWQFVRREIIDGGGIPY